MLTRFRKRLKHTDLAALLVELLKQHPEQERRKAKVEEDDDLERGSATPGFTPDTMELFWF